MLKTFTRTQQQINKKMWYDQPKKKEENVV